jgi:uncharacterized protein (TIRG00374 family)
MRTLVVFLQGPAGRLLRFLVSLGLLAAFAWSIDWAGLAAARGHFTLGPATAAVLLAGLTFPLHAWRWHLLLRPHGLNLGFAWAHWVTWIGQFYNSFLLGGLGGDAARVYYVCRDEPQRRVAGLAAIALDRAMGLAVLMALAVVALVAKSETLAHEPGLSWVFLTALALAVGGATTAGWVLVVEPSRWPVKFRRLCGDKVLAVVTDLAGGIRATPLAHLLALTASGAIWLLDIVSVWLLAQSVGLYLPFLETCLAVAVAYAATALPISVGGHGVREGAMLAVLGLFGLVGPAERDASLLLALLVWAVTVLWSLGGGLVLLAAARLLPSRAESAQVDPASIASHPAQ